MVIGITGGSGSGKSTVSKIFEKKGYYIVDSDKIGHYVIMPGKAAYNEVVRTFGSDILNPNLTINRKHLGNIVFSDKNKLEKLNRITHFYISKEIVEILKENTKVVIDGALLLESGISKLCDKTFFVSCPLEERIKRIMNRDKITRSEALLRINNQKDDNFYRENCDGEIINDGTKDIMNQVEALLCGNL